MKYTCEHVQNNQLIHKHIHLTIYQPLYWTIGRYVDIIHVRLYLYDMYMNICTYMLQQMQLMYTETPCLGENQRTQQSPKIPGNITLGKHRPKRGGVNCKRRD